LWLDIEQKTVRIYLAGALRRHHGMNARICGTGMRKCDQIGADASIFAPFAIFFFIRMLRSAII
jgi:hypothetical protein